MNIVDSSAWLSYFTGDSNHDYLQNQMSLSLIGSLLYQGSSLIKLILYGDL